MKLIKNNNNHNKVIYYEKKRVFLSSKIKKGLCVLWYVFTSNNNPWVVSLFILEPLLPVLFNPNHPETRFYRVSPRVIVEGGELQRARRGATEKERKSFAVESRGWDPNPSSGREHHLLAGWCLKPPYIFLAYTLLSPLCTVLVAYTFLFHRAYLFHLYLYPLFCFLSLYPLCCFLFFLIE